MTVTGCDNCEQWIEHAVERGVASVRLRCTNCGREERRPMRLLPLFIVTGASGVGKTAVVDELRRMLPDWSVFETDILWDSGRDWHFVRSNWLRVAHSLAQSGRPTILCGTMLPEDIDRCDHRDFFSRVYYVNLHCDDATRGARLRARPACRGCSDAFIAEHERFARWLLDHGRHSCEPPMHVIDTTDIPVAEVAQRIRDWALPLWSAVA
jgi:hypothetical protein